MICPNCDSIVNVHGCQSCGWKTGDPIPAHRMVHGTDHPLKPGGHYPTAEVAESAGYKVEVRHADGHWESYSGPYKTREAAKSGLAEVPRRLYKKARVVPA